MIKLESSQPDCLCIEPRQEHDNFGAVIHLVCAAFDLDGSAVLFDNAVAYPQAQSRAMLSLGGEERLKDLGQGSFRDSGAGIGDRDCDPWLSATCFTAAHGGAKPGAYFDDSSLGR